MGNTCGPSVSSEELREEPDVIRRAQLKREYLKYTGADAAGVLSDSDREPSKHDDGPSGPALFPAFGQPVEERPARPSARSVAPMKDATPLSSLASQPLPPPLSTTDSRPGGKEGKRLRGQDAEAPSDLHADEPPELTDTYNYAGDGVGHREEVGRSTTGSICRSVKDEEEHGKLDGENVGDVAEEEELEAVLRSLRKGDVEAQVPVVASQEPEGRERATALMRRRAPRAARVASLSGGALSMEDTLEARMKAKERQYQLKLEAKLLDREIKRIQKEEARLQKKIVAQAEKGAVQDVEELAKAIVQSRRTLSQLEQAKSSTYTADAKLSGALANVCIQHSMQASSEVLQDISAAGEVRVVDGASTGEPAECQSDDEEVNAEVRKVLEEVELERMRVLNPGGGFGVGDGIRASQPQPARVGC